MYPEKPTLFIQQQDGREIPVRAWAFRNQQGEQVAMLGGGVILGVIREVQQE